MQIPLAFSMAGQYEACKGGHIYTDHVSITEADNHCHQLPFKSVQVARRNPSVTTAAQVISIDLWIPTNASKHPSRNSCFLLVKVWQSRYFVFCSGNIDTAFGGMSNAQATQRSWNQEEEKILNQSSIETINNAEYAGKWKQRRYQQLRRVFCVDRRQPLLRVTLLLTRAVYHISQVMSIIFRTFADLLPFDLQNVH